jgi:hypothetical protein
MQVHICRRRPTLWSLVGLAVSATLVLTGCGKTPQAGAESSAQTSQRDSSQQAVPSDAAYFVDNVLKAWKQAGAEPGWIVHSDDGQFSFRTDPPNSMFVTLKATANVPRYLPGFRISNWHDGMTADLPAPKIGFGLDLYSSGITDTGLKELSRFDMLQSLNFYQGRITDEGVKELTALGSLRALSLYNTRLTDAAVKELAKIKTLEYVDLGGANVRASGGALFELQQALPDCTIFRRR